MATTSEKLCFRLAEGAEKASFTAICASFFDLWLKTFYMLLIVRNSRIRTFPVFLKSKIAGGWTRLRDENSAKEKYYVFANDAQGHSCLAG